MTTHGSAQIAKVMTEENKAEWSWVTRTYLFDTFLSRALQDGADLVLNLGAGLDSRPYRMELNATLQWVEMDFAEILSYKEGILANDRPRCRLARVALDISDVRGRRALFSALTAAEFNRAPEEFLALLPEPQCIPPHYPWTGVCLLERPER